MLMDDINALSAMISSHVFVELQEDVQCALKDKKAELCAKVMVPYLERLNRNKAHHGIAPHKAVMILTVMKMVEDGVMTGAVLRRSDQNMRRIFKQVWDDHVPRESRFVCEWVNPYKYLDNEPLWNLHHDGQYVDIDGLLIYAELRSAQRRTAEEIS